MRKIVLFPAGRPPLVPGTSARKPPQPRRRAHRARGRFEKPGVTMIEPMAVREAPEAQALEEYRTELTGYCYRMLGSAFEAEDAVQETMLRAWRALDKFQGRSQLRSWLYSIATNVCLDVLGGKERKVRPMQLGEPGAPVIESLAATRPQGEWILPMPDGRVVDDGGDPAEVAATKETLKLAFVAALQFLPPKQRAVLILRDVLRWKASEVAELLDTSEASVNSALQRARASVEEREVTADQQPGAMDDEREDLLKRYMDAFRSEEHTSELQSLAYLVCRLLLEKKKFVLLG